MAGARTLQGSRLEIGPVVRAEFVLTPIGPSLSRPTRHQRDSDAHGCGPRIPRSLRSDFMLAPVAATPVALGARHARAAWWIRDPLDLNDPLDLSDPPTT